MAHMRFPSSRRLPLPLTALIGREHEVAALVALVRREEMRLLILSGPGDVGKTRLALEVTAAVAESFPDGIWFVGLGAITDPELVASTVAEALDVREPRDHPIACVPSSVRRNSCSCWTSSSTSWRRRRWWRSCLAGAPA
jgi:hypothetical protein